jgi:hypothetical protein
MADAICKWTMTGDGVTDATCPACGTPLVIRVEFKGPFFEKKGSNLIYPYITLYRVPVNPDDPDREIDEEELDPVEIWWKDMAATRVEEIGREGSEVRSQRSEPGPVPRQNQEAKGRISGNEGQEE